MYTYNHWISNTEKPTTAKAFTYTIFFPETNHRYIGYKTISNRSKWLTYTSSSKYVKELLSEGHIAIYSIVNWFDNADDARAEEILLMTIHQVTKRPEFLNRSISGVKFSRAGIAHTSETRAKIGASRKGKTMSAETKAKMSVVHKGKTMSAESRAKISVAARNISAETRAKIGAASKGQKKPPRSNEHRAKIGAANKGRKLPSRSADTLAKMSESRQIGLYITPLGTFKTLKDASIAHECTLDTISRRCKSTSPKFKDWYFQPNK